MSQFSVCSKHFISRALIKTICLLSFRVDAIDLECFIAVVIIVLSKQSARCGHIPTSIVRLFSSPKSMLKFEKIRFEIFIARNLFDYAQVEQSSLKALLHRSIEYLLNYFCTRTFYDYFWIICVNRNVRSCTKLFNVRETLADN